MSKLQTLSLTTMTDRAQGQAKASKQTRHGAGEHARREEKKRKQWESIRCIFRDPLETVAARPCDPVLRQYCREVAEKDDKVKEKIRKLSAESEKTLGHTMRSG